MSEDVQGIVFDDMRYHQAAIKVSWVYLPARINLCDAQLYERSLMILEAKMRSVNNCESVASDRPSSSMVHFCSCR